MSRAFTLLEVVIAIAISTVLMLAITQLYILYGRVIVFQQSAINVALGGSSVMDAVRLAGLQAKQVVATHTFSGVDYSSGPTTVLFELPAIDASGAIIADMYDYVGIYASDTDVFRVVDAAVGSARSSGEKRLTDVLGALNVSYDNPNFPSVASVTVDITTSDVVREVTTQVHLREHVYLRNL